MHRRDSVFARETWRCWFSLAVLPALAPELPLLRLRSVYRGWAAPPSPPLFLCAPCVAKRSEVHAASISFPFKLFACSSPRAGMLPPALQLRCSHVHPCAMPACAHSSGPRLSGRRGSFERCHLTPPLTVRPASLRHDLGTQFGWKGWAAAAASQGPRIHSHSLRAQPALTLFKSSALHSWLACPCSHPHSSTCQLPWQLPCVLQAAAALCSPHPLIHFAYHAIAFFSPADVCTYRFVHM